jgi:hypothetical protein
MGAIYRDILPHTPNLRHLSLRFRDHSILLETLALLHAPNLESPTISRVHFWYVERSKLPWAALDRVLAERFPNVH